MDIETHSEFQEMAELFQDEDWEKKAKLTVELEKIKKSHNGFVFHTPHVTCHLSNNLYHKQTLDDEEDKKDNEDVMNTYNVCYPVFPLNPGAHNTILEACQRNSHRA